MAKNKNNNQQAFWVVLALVIAVLLFGGFLTKEEITVEAGSGDEACQGKACCGDDSVWKDGKCGGGDCEDDGKKDDGKKDDGKDDDGKKDGQCPRPEGYGVCWEQCSSNDDCSGNQLCCSNGCGHICIDPASGGNGSEGSGKGPGGQPSSGGPTM